MTADRTTPDDPGLELPPVTLRALAPSAFLPAFTHEVGNGAIAPVVALTALHLGASVSMAALLLALLGVGQVLGDVPAAALADRIGDRRAMIVAAALGTFAYLMCLLSRSLPVFALALLLIGMANATFYLARLSYLTEVAPAPMRARVMSTLAGSHRVGLFVGPFLGAAVISLYGIQAAYAVAMGTAVCTGVMLVLVPDVIPPDGGSGARRTVSPVGFTGGSRAAAGARADGPGAVTSRAMGSLSAAGPAGSWTVLRRHGRLFATMGMAMVALAAVRAVRQTVLPLWAGQVGISPEATSLVFGIAGAVELLVFYPSGKVMDQWGRLAVAVPSTVLLGLAIMAVPLTGGFWSLAVVAMLMGVGSGIGAGVVMTLGADIAPIADRVRFLGLWRLVSDTGNAAGPVVVSAVATIWALAAGIVAIGSAGLIAAVAFMRWTPRYSPYATPASTRAHRS